MLGLQCVWRPEALLRIEFLRCCMCTSCDVLLHVRNSAMGCRGVHLVYGALHVTCIGGGHRLQRDSVLAADLDGPNLHSSMRHDFDTMYCILSAVRHQLRHQLRLSSQLSASSQHLTSTVRVGRRRVCHVLSQYLAVLPTGLSV